MRFHINKIIINNNKVRLAAKAILSAALLFIILHSCFFEGLRPYQSYKDYNYQSEFSDESSTQLLSETTISQTFTAKGNYLDNVSVYFVEGIEQKINASISDTEGNIIAEKEFYTADYTKNAWNEIGLYSDKLKRNQIYTISFTASDVMDSMIVNKTDMPVIFGKCYSSGGEVEGALAIGMQFTYTYFTLGSMFEIALKAFFAVLLGVSLCYVIFKIELLWAIFRSTEKKAGMSYAIFFAAITAMLFNPMDPTRNHVTEFNRIIGSGILSDVDVSKRISNFNFWYILFGLTFIGFFLLCNAMHQKEKSEDTQKAQKFLDDFIVLSNCCLLIKCITYFQEESGTEVVFHFSEYVMLLVICVAAAYILFHMERYISLERFGKLCLLGAALSYPVAIIIAQEWGAGRILLGILFIFAAAILLLIKLCGAYILDSPEFDAALHAGTFVLPFAPLMTSFYIELIHVMNQWGIFVAHPAKYYKIALLLGLVAWGMSVVLFLKLKLQLPRWKSAALPVFIFGISCLANQIPISDIYNPDIFEGANAGILISDFLNFGAIPNVEHYGGHMMTGVWEGILYGIINRDFAGAFVSPYSSLLAPFLCVLFYCLVKCVWNDTIALFAALLFPFYSAWSYYGLGMLICLAAMAYIKKHTYPRAILVWGTFIWCTLYRLDLGVAFGVALIASMAVYCFVTKDKTAARQLFFTLAGWGVFGTVLWFGICFSKEINPVNRLLEFLMVNLSNQNWAYAGIGNMDVTLFSWAYIIVPFLIVIVLIYVLFSKELRDRIGLEKWVMVQMFGWCYFANFSRGLVRHSLAETATSVIIWCGYLFLAMAVSCYKKSQKFFLPSFFILLLCNTLFITDSNFSQRSILDSAATKPEAILESWQPGRFDEEDMQETLTYWEQLQRDREIVQRVQLDNDLQKYAGKYEILDLLLEDGETFADFINKTLLYCILDRECPVYVSQSPLQLSGEFMQEEFIKEIADVPIVLMPGDIDYRGAHTLDSITNAYRYYKVAEYIYENYVPLYKYGTDYTVWCRPERYEAYRELLTESIVSTEYVELLLESESLKLGQVKLYDEGGWPVVEYTETDPMITELQTMIDVSPFIGNEMMLLIEYETDVSGAMQLFYTTEEGENYNGDKVVTVNISGHGTAAFTIPITSYTRLRLNMPEHSKVKIFSFVARSAEELISYGYDGPIELIGADGSVSYSYIGSNHNHNLNHLPRIWAEEDEKNSGDNLVLQRLVKQDDLFVFNGDAVSNKNGNYLKITADYDGNDTDGLFEEDDEYLGGTVVFGEYEDGEFKEKYRYNLTFMEGRHEYIIRCSTDYFWYIGNVNAVQFQADGDLYNIEMYLLEGD